MPGHIKPRAHGGFDRRGLFRAGRGMFGLRGLNPGVQSGGGGEAGRHPQGNIGKQAFHDGFSLSGRMHALHHAS